MEPCLAGQASANAVCSRLNSGDEEPCRRGVGVSIIARAVFAEIVGVYQKYSFADQQRVALSAWAAHVSKPGPVPP
jgi:hypothetical protein